MIKGEVAFFIFYFLKNNDLYFLGVFVVMSVIHGGNGLPILSETVYNYLVSGSYNYCMDIKVDDIPDPSLQFITEKVYKCYHKLL